MAERSTLMSSWIPQPKVTSQLDLVHWKGCAGISVTHQVTPLWTWQSSAGEQAKGPHSGQGGRVDYSFSENLLSSCSVLFSEVFCF